MNQVKKRDHTTPQFMRFRLPITFLFFCVLLYSCGKEPVPADAFNVLPSQLRQFEGRVSLGTDELLRYEIDFIEGDITGEGIYKMKESLETPNGLELLQEITGQYTSAFGYGDQQDAVIIRLHHSSLPDGVKRVFKANPSTRIITEEVFRKKDLTLGKINEFTLMVLDNRLQPVSDDADHFLYRKTSRPFTVEGYFVHLGNNLSFHELNTDEDMDVAKLGEYETALKNYYQLRIEKSEKLYLKGVGYTTVVTDAKTGKQKEMLVLKKIIQMQSSAVAEN